MLRTYLLVALVVIIFVVRRSDTANLGSIVSNKTATSIGTGISLKLGTTGTNQTGKGAPPSLSLGSSGSKKSSTIENIQTSMVAPTKNSSQDNVKTIIDVVSNNFRYK
jgi:hypothetical protein